MSQKGDYWGSMADEGPLQTQSLEKCPGSADTPGIVSPGPALWEEGLRASPLDGLNNPPRNGLARPGEKCSRVMRNN